VSIWSATIKLHRPELSAEVCGDREEDMPLYGILIPSPSYTVRPPGGSGAGIAQCAECGQTDAGAEADLWEVLTLILVVFL